MASQPHDEHHHIELPTIIEPMWAKVIAPLCALGILAYLCCSYLHLM